MEPGSTHWGRTSERRVTRAPDEDVHLAAHTRTVSEARKDPCSRVTTLCRWDFWTSIGPPHEGQGSSGVSKGMMMPVRLKVCSRRSSSSRDRSSLRNASASRTFFFTQAVLLKDRLDLGERHALALTLE